MSSKSSSSFSVVQNDLIWDPLHIFYVLWYFSTCRNTHLLHKTMLCGIETLSLSPERLLLGVARKVKSYANWPGDTEISDRKLPRYY